MPDTISNPFGYTTPIGQSLAQFGQVLMHQPSEGKRILEAEAALKLKRERENLTDSGAMFLKYGTPEFDRNRAVASAITGGLDPTRLGTAERYLSSNQYGVSDSRTSAAFVGAGGAFGSTPQGFQQTRADDMTKARMADDTKRYEFDNKPQVIGTDKGPVIARTSQAYGQPAVEDIGKVKGNAARVAMNAPGGLAAADPTTQVFIGADKDRQRTPHNYLAKDGQTFQTYDGITDARTGQPLPTGLVAGVQGTPEQSGLRPNVTAKLQEQDLSGQRLMGLSNYARGLITHQNVGATGVVKGIAQDATQLAGNLAAGLGYTGVQDAIADMQKRARDSGVDPNSVSGLFTFDPRLPKLDTAYHMLVLSGADALAGGMGKASDRDIKIVKQIVGDPTSLFASPESLNAKLDALHDIIGINNGVNAPHLRGGAATTPAAPAQAAPGAGTVPTPQAAPGAPQLPPDPLGIR